MTGLAPGSPLLLYLSQSAAGAPEGLSHLSNMGPRNINNQRAPTSADFICHFHLRRPAGGSARRRPAARHSKIIIKSLTCYTQNRRDHMQTQNRRSSCQLSEGGGACHSERTTENCSGISHFCSPSSAPPTVVNPESLSQASRRRTPEEAGDSKCDKYID